MQPRTPARTVRDRKSSGTAKPRTPRWHTTQPRRRPGARAACPRTVSVAATADSCLAKRGFFGQLADSVKIGPAAAEVDSWALAGAGFVGVALSLASFNALAAGPIAASAAAAGTPADASLLFLDLHFSYDAAETARLLGAYGHGGRLAYLAVEALDVALYHTAYRALFLVLLNRATAAVAGSPLCPEPARAPLRALAQAPIVVAALDGLEDCFQVRTPYFFAFSLAALRVIVKLSILM